jgi:hypothetical protein
MAEKMCGGHHTHVHAWVLEEHGESIAPCIAMGSEFVESGAVFPGVPVPGSGIASPDGVCLGSYVLSGEAEQHPLAHGCSEVGWRGMSTDGFQQRPS